MERKRVFIAINLPEEIKNILASKQEEIEENFQSFGENFHPIRWTKKENLHITIEFLGYLNKEEIEKVKRVLSEISNKFSPFKIKLGELTYAPEKEKIPRMIWVIGDRNEVLSSIKEKLDRDLAREIGFRPERREFNIHITLGRIRKWEFKVIPLEERPSLEKNLDLEFKAKSLDLMESKLSPRGPKYFLLEKYSFRAL